MNNIFNGNSITYNNLAAYISNFLPITDLLRLQQVNRLQSIDGLVSSSWRAIAESINCPFERNEDISILKNRIKNRVLDLKVAIRNFSPKHSNENSEKIPEDIQTILNNPTFPNVEEINLLSEYAKARDVVILWQTLAEAIDSPFDLHNNFYQSSGTVIQFAKQFENWCIEENNTLGQITELDLSGKKLSHLPIEIENLTQLTKLYLDDNQLKQVSPELGNLRQLTLLHLHNNHLTELPPEIGNLTQLQELILRNNQLHQLPSEFGNLNQLLNLEMQQNKLSQLPESFKNLTRLEYLNLGNNKFETFPESILNLRQLQSLHLEKNKLETIPDEICNLNQLEDLYLHQNQFHQTPQSLKSLPSLTTLTLRSNPIASLPRKIGQVACAPFFNGYYIDFKLFMSRIFLGAIIPLSAYAISLLASEYAEPIISTIASQELALEDLEIFVDI